MALTSLNWLTKYLQMFKQITLIRHTSVAPGRGQCYGFTDVGVSKNFKAEVKWLKTSLAGQQFDRVLASPLSRCTQLCETLFQEYKKDDRLKELNYGDWEGRSWEEINIPENSDWLYLKSGEKAPNGESFENLKKRVAEVFEELQKEEGKTIIFCHGGVIRSFLSLVTGLPLPLTKSIKIHYCAQVTLSFEENIWRLSKLNGGYLN